VTAFISITQWLKAKAIVFNEASQNKTKVSKNNPPVVTPNVLKQTSLPSY
jgi:hypothetical protein